MSHTTGDISWILEEMLKILLEGSEADLDALHEQIMFFSIAMGNCQEDWEKQKIATARWVFLKNRYGIYFGEDDE